MTVLAWKWQRHAPMLTPAGTVTSVKGDFLAWVFLRLLMTSAYAMDQSFSCPESEDVNASAASCESYKAPKGQDHWNLAFPHVDDWIRSCQHQTDDEIPCNSILLQWGLLDPNVCWPRFVLKSSNIIQCCCSSRVSHNYRSCILSLLVEAVCSALGLECWLVTEVVATRTSQ